MDNLTIENPIIKSILDTDLYKLTMQCAVCKLYPNVSARYVFINRGHDWDTNLTEELVQQLEQEVEMMQYIILTKDEAKFLRKTCGSFLDDAYIDFLSGYRFNANEVKIINNGGHLVVDVEGPWYRTILWEVPLLATISELYFKLKGIVPFDLKNRFNNDAQQNFDVVKKAYEVASQKSQILTDCNFADFGTRRRFSYDVHKATVRGLIDGWINWDSITPFGTSNVHLAHKFNIRPIGTQAHEWFSFHGAKYGFTMANSMALKAWTDVYRGSLGIALTDTFTTKNFWSAFDTMYAKLYDGVRHDSGDPYVFGEDAIYHYTSLGIDPKTKTIVFSDGLDPARAIDIQSKFNNRIKVSFGIGTNFTNDVGAKPLNIVMKMVGTRLGPNQPWIPTIKLSDVQGKNTGDPETIKLAKQTLGIK